LEFDFACERSACNVSWEKEFLFYADAEKSIEKDLQQRHDEGTPHYMIDKSYIAIYPFSELQFMNAVDRYRLGIRFITLLKISNQDNQQK
jgi:hypothetical protein